MEIKIPPIEVNFVTDTPNVMSEIDRLTDVPQVGPDGTQSDWAPDGTEWPEERPDILAPAGRRPLEAHAAEHGGATATDQATEVDLDGTLIDPGETGEAADGSEPTHTDHDQAEQPSAERGDGEQRHERFGPENSGVMEIESMTKEDLAAAQRQLLRNLGIPEKAWPEELREPAPEQQTDTPDKPEGQPDAVKTDADKAEADSADKADADAPKAAADEVPADTPAAEQHEEPETPAAETPAPEPSAAGAAADAANSTPAEEPESATDTSSGTYLDASDGTTSAGSSELNTEVYSDRPNDHTEVQSMAAMESGAAHDDTAPVSDGAVEATRVTALTGEDTEGTEDESDDGNDLLDEPPELASMMRPTLQPGAVAVQNLEQADQGWQDHGAVASGDKHVADQPAPAYTPAEWTPTAEHDPLADVDVPTGSVAVGQANEEHPVTLSATVDGTVVATAWSKASQVGAMVNISETEGDLAGVTRQALHEASDAAPALQTDDIQVSVMGAGQSAAATDPDRPTVGQAVDATRDVLGLGGSPSRDIERLTTDRDLPEGSEVRMDVATGRVTAVGPAGEPLFSMGGVESSDASQDDAVADTAGDGGGGDE